MASSNDEGSLEGPKAKELRFAVEHSLGAALDWDDQNQRNEMMYESAEPLARLYDPLFVADDTFVLQVGIGSTTGVFRAKELFHRLDECRNSYLPVTLPRKRPQFAQHNNTVRLA